jgi:hypothetical protein
MQIIYVGDIYIAIGFDHSLADRAYRLMQNMQASFMLRGFYQCQSLRPSDYFTIRATFILQQL